MLHDSIASSTNFSKVRRQGRWWGEEGQGWAEVVGGGGEAGDGEEGCEESRGEGERREGEDGDMRDGEEGGEEKEQEEQEQGAPLAFKTSFTTHSEILLSYISPMIIALGIFLSK